ncbi:hypothetical protein OU5_5532 [Pseudomonas mandelii JR-1]|uniref:Uncharacterized protein n=1 Tax=Pseudomonas mandelii JR-1 TaxID=1147786 RepID=A0A024EJ32_9PSED|nr:hypothetical protein [Pseudomonas mandelii]AHZ72611.1 hypothetical protein OU5_5532 [Pseudomonas mandelii JR-1]OYQ00831.1 hypothetical protein B7L09_27810 [Pseudomonas mandelii]
MTAIQICALISIIIAAALLYWIGYRGGLANGRIEGIDEGINSQRTESAKTIRELEASLQFIRADHQRLAEHSRRSQDSNAIGEEHHQTMLDIAEKLRIAAETFRAFRTGKKLERDTRALRDQTLAMAALLVPATQEDAA